MARCASEVPVEPNRFLESLMEEIQGRLQRPGRPMPGPAELGAVVERLALIVLRRLPAHASLQVAHLLPAERFPPSAFRLESGDPSLGFPDLLACIRCSGLRDFAGFEEGEVAEIFLLSFGLRLPEALQEVVLRSMPAEFRQRMLESRKAA